MSDLDRVRQSLLAAFAGRPQEGPPWLAVRRQAAMERFEALGFPHRRQEEWRYTPLNMLSEAPFAAAPEADAAALAGLDLGFEGLAAHRLVFGNGRLRAELCETGGLPSGVTLGSLAAALQQAPAPLEAHLDTVSESGRHAFRALNSGFSGDGAFLHVPADTHLDRPVQVAFLATTGEEPWVAYPRLLVILEPGARAELVVSFLGQARAAYTSNAVVEVVLGEGSRLTQVTDQRESAAAFHFDAVKARLGAGSSWTHFSVNMGGRLVRNEVEAELVGEEARVELDGLSASTDSQHVENFTTIDHAVARCTSRELYKAILEGDSTGVFRGRVVVRQDAQLTDSQQQNKNLLLSPGAAINAKPELEIYADDVKAAHGATIGQLDPEQVFFLRSRGIDEAQARRILVQAFARDLLNKIELEPVRDGLKRAFSARFGGADEEG